MHSTFTGLIIVTFSLPVQYFCIPRESTTTSTVKGSRFIAFAFPVTSEEDIQIKIRVIKSLHPKARHWCYAWKLGTKQIQFRIQDDGEPSGTAGRPIYQQIESKQLSNVLVVVVRYFGGILLGTGGLIKAYKEAAKSCLDAVQPIPLISFIEITVHADLPKLQRIITHLKELNVAVTSSSIEMQGFVSFRIQETEKDSLLKNLKARLDKMPIHQIQDTTQWNDCILSIHHQ